MVVILDHYTIPEQGNVALNINLSFDIKVTAEEAQHKAKHWLRQEVSYLLRALAPTLVIGEQIVWRVPISLGLPHLGQVGKVGVVEVDVNTGTMNNTPECKAAIEHCAEMLVARFPPYQPSREVASEYLAKNVPPAPKLQVQNKPSLTVTSQ